MKPRRSSSSSSSSPRADDFGKVLEGATPAERERATALFHSLLSGDPASFPVQLALITRDSLEAAARARREAQAMQTELDGARADLRETREAVAALTELADGYVSKARAAAGEAETSRTSASGSAAVVEEVAQLLRNRDLTLAEVRGGFRELGVFRGWTTALLLSLAAAVGFLLAEYISARGLFKTEPEFYWPARPAGYSPPAERRELPMSHTPAEGRGWTGE